MAFLYIRINSLYRKKYEHDLTLCLFHTLVQNIFCSDELKKDFESRKKVNIRFFAIWKDSIQKGQVSSKARGKFIWVAFWLHKDHLRPIFSFNFFSPGIKMISHESYYI